ncbi:MAG: hypothetical protein L0Z70_03350 [Chloroflexi bacterium]|nr:hypothetical protein [Chloroflexota bacterium]
MDEPFHPLNQLERNPITHHKHRGEVFWQITAPLILGVLLILAAGAGVVLASAAGNPQVGRWASVSIIWLIIPALLAMLVLLALVGALAYGVSWLLRWLPGFALRVQDFFVLVNVRVSKAAAAAAAPALRIQGWIAAWQAMRRRLF